MVNEAVREPSNSVAAALPTVAQENATAPSHPHASTLLEANHGWGPMGPVNGTANFPANRVRISERAPDVERAAAGHDQGTRVVVPVWLAGLLMHGPRHAEEF